MRELAQTTLDKAKEAAANYMTESQKLKEKADCGVRATKSSATGACRRYEIWQHVRLVGIDAGCVLGGAWQADRLDQAVYEGEEHVLCARQGFDRMVRGRHH